MIRCILDLDAYRPAIAAEFCEFSVDRIDALVAILRAKLTALREAKILYSDEIKVSINFGDIHQIPKVESDILVAFVRSQEDLVCRLELSGRNLVALSNLRHLVDLALLAALKARMMQLKADPPFALPELFAKGRPDPSLTKVMRNSHQELSLLSPAATPVWLPEVKVLMIPEVPYGLLMDYQNANHPDFQQWREVLTRIPKTTIEKIVYHLGAGGLQYLCQNLQVFAGSELRVLLEVFFSGRDQDKLFFLCFPNGIQYLSVMDNWPQELRAHFFRWSQQCSEPLDFFNAVAAMQQFWQTIAYLSPDITVPHAFKTTAEFNLIQHLTTLDQLMQMVGEPYRKIQAGLLFHLSYRPLRDYQTLLAATGCCWIAEEMFTSDVRAEPMDLCQPLTQASKANFFRYLGQHLQDYSTLFNQISIYSVYIERLEDAIAPFAWSLAAWVGGSLQLMTIEQFEILYHSFLMVENKSDLLRLLFSLPSRYRPTFDNFAAILALTGRDEVMLSQAIQFYTDWHQALERGYLDAWPLLLGLLASAPVEARRAVFAERFVLDFEAMYFRSLLLIFGIRPEELPELTEQFQSLGARRAEIIAILSSIESNWQAMNPRALSLILQISTDSAQNMEDLFAENLPGFQFKYFSSMVDYGLVLSRMERLLNSVKTSLDFFLGDTKFFIIAPPVKKLLSAEALLQLQAQYTHLQAVELELQALTKQRQNLDFNRLFELFKVFDRFFLEFVEQHLGRIFVPFLFHLLPRLDPKLKPDSSLKQLMRTVLDQHQKIAATHLAQHLKPEMLKILVEDESLPLMQRFLQKFLVDDLCALLSQELVEKLKDSLVPQALRQQLSTFLCHLPLEVEALHQFFLRYQGIRQVIKAWPGIEQALVALNLHPELPIQIWQVVVDAQLLDGEPDFSGHWHLSLQLLKQVLHWLQAYPCAYFSIPNFLTTVYQAKPALKTIGVLGNGDLCHPHLTLLWSSLETWFALYLTNPLCLQLLPQAMDAILVKGQSYDYSKGLEIYQKMGGHSQLSTQLLAVNGQDALVAGVLSAIQTLLTIPGDWSVVVDKLFSGIDLHSQLRDGHRALDWLLRHRDYPWLEMIADDQDFELTQMMACMEHLSLPSPWTLAYAQRNADATPTIAVTAPREAPQHWWSRLFKAQAPLPAPPPVADRAPACPHVLLAKQAWMMWSQAPYPGFARLNTWLGQLPLACHTALLAFDCYPRGNIDAYIIREQDISAWMEELTFYGRTAVDKLKLTLRLKTVIALINQALTQSRQNLVQRFYKLRNLVHQDVDLAEIKPQLLSVIAALYCKTTGRRPYPTQILTLLVSLECMDKNLVFEVDTGEGKGITTALMAVLKWALKKDITVEIHTANRDLVRQDYHGKGHWRFFQSLGIVHRIIQEDSPRADYQPLGIYYTTQDDMAVFKELCRLQAQQPLPKMVEVIVDEVDHVILDQTMLINLSIPIESKVDWFDFYQFINQFIDKHWSSMQRHSWQDWGKMLKTDALRYYQSNKFRQGLLLILPMQGWRDWIEVAVYAKLLEENRDFIVEAIEQAGKTLYQVLPYLKSEIKYGFDISYQSKSGLKPLLHARLQSAERNFSAVAETQFLAQLSSNYLAEVNSFIGLTGSLGAVSECRELRESLFANLVRIPRFFPSRLVQAAPSLRKNAQELLHELLQKLSAETHPVLICVPEIEAAEALYLQLSISLNQRTIRLLTGQESRWSRARWLQQSSHNCYAGTAGAITIATLICGRGTDIVVEPPNYLKIYQWGVLEPRHTMQLKGRTARNNQPGYYQLLLDAESLGFSGKQDVLDKLLAHKQSQLILEGRHQRLKLRMKSWLRKYILEILHQTLAQVSLDASQQMAYYTAVVQEIGEVQADEALNPTAYFGLAKMILQTAMAKLVVRNLIRKGDQEERLMDCLAVDKERWAAVIPQVFQALPVSTAHFSTGIKFCAEDYQFFISQLNLSATRPQSWYQRLVYQTQDLEKMTLQIVHDAYQHFVQEPQPETFEIFYTSLVSAQILYQQRQQHHRYAKYYSPLALWSPVLERLQVSIQLRKVLLAAPAGLWSYLQAEMLKMKPPVLQGWKKYLLRFFFPHFFQYLQQLDQACTTFRQQPSADGLAHLALHLNQFVRYYHTLSHSWWAGFWLRQLWPSVGQGYLDLQAKIPQWTNTYIKSASSCAQWFEQQQAISLHQLAYRQRIVDELKISHARGAHGFWCGKLSENLSLAAELDELGRIFPQQINALYARFYHSTTHHLSQHPRRWVLLAVLRAYFSPFNPKLTLDLIGADMKVLLGEFDRWSHTRQLLVEWDEMNPSLG